MVGGNKQKHASAIEIRIARKDDAASIALLGRVTFTETFGHFFTKRQDLIDYYASTFSVAKIEHSLSKRNSVYWIAFLDRLPVGYAKLKLNSPSKFIEAENVGQLQKIYVLKDFLSMKIGSELQQRLLNKAKEENCRKIWLSVLNKNARAIRFYEKNGYKQIGNHKFKIGAEEFEFINMSKQLN